MEPSLAQFFELSIDLLCVADTSGYFRRVSPAFTETLGWSADELLARPFLALVHPEDLAATQREIERLAAGQSTVRFENRYRASDGRWIWLSWTCRPEPDTELLYAVARDVTADKAMAASLLRMRDEAERANRAKSRFLTAMSHELRTPLNAILGYSEMLGEDADELGLEGMGTDLRRIRDAGRHLLELINEVLDLSRVEAGRMDLDVGAVDLGALVDAVTHTIEPLAAKQGNRLVVETAPGLGVIATDGTKLRQILINLLGNACKFTHGGEVRLTVMRDHAGTHFVVSDDGIGIAAEELEQIFEPFARGTGTRARDYAGTGLGLPISKRYASLLSGDLDVTSTLGEGTRFTLTLWDAPALAEADAVRAPILDGAPATVLVIDDDPDARHLLERCLVRAGYRVATAAGADEGLALAARLRPRLILLDLLMPGRDGWSALAALQADPDLAATPIVIVSAVDAHHVGFALGVEGYVTKPVDRAALLDTVDRAFDRGAPTGPILVVEDDPAARDLLSRSLSARGYDVIEARDGKEGLERLEEHGASLILLDLVMPNLDGFELAERVRRDTRWDDVPIVVVSAADPGPAELARLDGKVLDVLRKGDSTADVLLTQVQRLLAGNAPA